MTTFSALVQNIERHNDDAIKALFADRTAIEALIGEHDGATGAILLQFGAQSRNWLAVELLLQFGVSAIATVNASATTALSMALTRFPSDTNASKHARPIDESLVQLLEASALKAPKLDDSTIVALLGDPGVFGRVSLARTLIQRCATVTALTLVLSKIMRQIHDYDWANKPVSLHTMQMVHLLLELGADASRMVDWLCAGQGPSYVGRGRATLEMMRFAIACGARATNRFVPCIELLPFQLAAIQFDTGVGVGERKFVADVEVIGLYTNIDDSVAEQLLRDARTQVSKMRFDLIRDRAFEICVALQALELPAFVSLQIVDCMTCFASLVPMHTKWSLITTVKHFLNDPPPAQLN